MAWDKATWTASIAKKRNNALRVSFCRAFFIKYLLWRFSIKIKTNKLTGATVSLPLFQAQSQRIWYHSTDYIDRITTSLTRQKERSKAVVSIVRIVHVHSTASLLTFLCPAQYHCIDWVDFTHRFIRFVCLLACLRA